MAAEFEGVTCIGESARAILVVIEGKDYWIPKAHVTDDSEVYKHGDTGKLVITDWIATEKKLA